MLADGFQGDVAFFVAAQFVAYRLCSVPELNWVDSGKPHVVALGRHVPLRHSDHPERDCAQLCTARSFLLVVLVPYPRSLHIFANFVHRHGFSTMAFRSDRIC